MEDPTQNNSPQIGSDINQPQDENWMAYHNDKIIGFYSNQQDADDALHGYQMENEVGIDDVLEARQVI